MGPVSARFSLSERQTLARSTFLSRIATRFRHNACDTQPLLSEPPFVIPSGCAVPFFRTRPFARERLSRFAGGVGSRRFSFASFFPSSGFTPERAALLPMGGRVFSDPRMPLLPVFPAFSATVFCRSRPIVFRCKVRVPTGTTCQILTNGVAAQIFLYRACGLGLRPKIKRIYALSLVHPSAAPTF